MENDSLHAELSEKKAEILKLTSINTMQQSSHHASHTQNQEYKLMFEKLQVEKGQAIEMYEKRVEDIRSRLNEQLNDLQGQNKFNLDYIQSLQQQNDDREKWWMDRQ